LHKQSSKWRFTFVLIASCIGFTLIAFVLIAYLHLPKRGLPYHDSFTTGKADEWEAFGGTWTVDDGGMRNDSDERGAKLMAGSPYWNNYLLEADIKLLGEDGDAGLVIRASDEEQGVDSYSGYYAGLRTRDNALTLGHANHGWLEYRSTPMPQGVQAFRWYHLKLLAFQCQIIASATSSVNANNNSTVAINEPNCLKSGRIGLRSYSAGGLWRNVQARAATETDLRAMLAGLSPQQLSNESASAENEMAMFGSGSLPSHLNPQQTPPVADIKPISSLRLVSSSHRVVSTVRGVVSLTSPALYVQDSTGGIAVKTSSTPPLKVGDEVQVTGAVIPGAFSSTLQDATIQLLWARTPVQPVSVTASQAATGSFAATFIEVEGYLRSREHIAPNILALNLEAGQQSFRALVNEGRGDLAFRILKPNSLLRLRGVCVVDPEFTHSLTPFVLLMRSTDDVQIVAGPPWWNTRHLVAIGFALLVLIFISHFIYSKIEQWRLRAIFDERELLAHEMHDTLAQSFAGLGFQLQAIRNRMPDDMPAVHQQLDLACDLVRHSHEEARRNIAMLRTEALERIDLVHMLECCAQKMLEGGQVETEVSQTGDGRSVPMRINDTLFRIGQEALANSVRHAMPTRIRISARYTEDSVELEIEDDGTGYDKHTEQKGFGIKGMRRRAAAISGVLEITSAPGTGTRVHVTAPLPMRLTFRTWPSYLSKLWRRIPGLQSNGQTREETYSYLNRR
jgi:signal transduction histidine kinase